jgi:hypothetical protein
MKVSMVTAVARGIVLADDVIVELNGVSLDGGTYREIFVKNTKAMESVGFDKPVRLKVRRQGQLVDLTITPGVSSREDYAVVPMDYGSGLFDQVRRGWISPIGK